MVLPRVLRRGPTFRFVFLCVCAIAIYLGFQIFSVKLLTSSSKRRNSAPNDDRDVEAHRPVVKIDALGRLLKPNFPAFARVVKKNNLVINEMESLKKIIAAKERRIFDFRRRVSNSVATTAVAVVRSFKPLGMNPELIAKYQPDGEGRFTCFNSGEKMNISRVNDDYCDCEDGSDEPGTSACANSRFYCTTQIAGINGMVVSSRVNDGICDCCDGSDEWNNITLPDNIRIDEDKLKYVVMHAPCQSTCYIHLKALEAERQIQQRGAVMKQEYLKYAIGQPFMEHIHGPHGLFYKLSETCFNFETSQYKYIVCPFREVRQDKLSQSPKNIGRTPTLSRLDADEGGGWMLVMDRGDADGCPDGDHRKSLIRFKCGLTDRVSHVDEDERCVYKFTFQTPAAC
ncbi:uncharacterized protein LOC141909665 isoform X2 [Tubulanus polymorphus]|uniref:uncharacterized protein LOC141909665 isoform X2 n=1 Tax=Tubulanus polymorphus TaxID=672921 RepID=UPI003DA6837C